MKLVGRERLENFTENHPDAKQWIANWLAEVGTTTWSTPQDIKERYRSASILPGNIVIFNVKGNAYRLAVQVAYDTETVVVKRVGTHSDYMTWRW